MVDYSKWSNFDAGSDSDRAPEPGAKLCRDMVNDPMLRRRCMEQMRSVHRKEAREDAEWLRRRAEEESRVVRRAKPAEAAAVRPKRKRASATDYAKWDKLCQGIDSSGDERAESESRSKKRSSSSAQHASSDAHHQCKARPQQQQRSAQGSGKPLCLSGWEMSRELVWFAVLACFGVFFPDQQSRVVDSWRGLLQHADAFGVPMLWYATVALCGWSVLLSCGRCASPLHRWLRHGFGLRPQMSLEYGTFALITAFLAVALLALVRAVAAGDAAPLLCLVAAASARRLSVCVKAGSRFRDVAGAHQVSDHWVYHE